MTQYNTISEIEPADGVLRRTVLKASTVAVGTVGMIALVTGAEHEDEDDEDGIGNESEENTENDDKDNTDHEDKENDETNEDDATDDSSVDEPERFSVEVLAPHANFPDNVAAEFQIEYTDGEMDTITSDLADSSTVVVAKVTWQPEGTSGWHTHPGPVIVTITQGELELINERDCVVRTYTAGEAFLDPGQGNIHIASNPSETECAMAYATFLGVPDGAPATEWVEPPDC